MNIQLNSQTIFANFPDLVTINDLQRMLGIGRNTAYNLIKEKKIKSIKINTSIKIAKQSVMEFILNGGTK